MENLRASNVWDDDYVPPADNDKLRGECAKMYMELRDLDVQLADIKYRQLNVRRIYSICIIIAVVLLVVAIITGGIRLFYYRQPIGGISAYLVNGGIVIGALLAGISSAIFFCAMSVNSFWAGCANFLRIEKLEIKRLGCIREKSAMEHRLEELEGLISEEKTENETIKIKTD